MFCPLPAPAAVRSIRCARCNISCHRHVWAIYLSANCLRCDNVKIQAGVAVSIDVLRRVIRDLSEYTKSADRRVYHLNGSRRNQRPQIERVRPVGVILSGLKCLPAALLRLLSGMHMYIIN